MTSPITLRFATQTQYDLGRITRDLADLQTQLATGKKSLELSGYGEEASQIISFSTAKAGIESRRAAISEVVARFDQQTAALHKAAQSSFDLATAIRTAISANDGRGMETELELAFSSISNALNETYNGQPFFGGERYGAGPIKTRTLDQLAVAAIPADVFDEATRQQLFDMGVGAPIPLAEKASEFSQGAFEAMKRLKLLIDANGGTLPQGLSGAMQAELDTLARQLETAGIDMSNAEGRAGQLQQSLERESVRLEERNNMLKKALGGVADADMAQVAIQLNSLTLQYQALGKSYSQLSSLSLLNFLD